MSSGSDVALPGAMARPVEPAKVARVIAALPGADTVAELADVFGLLADPGRLRLLTALLEGGEMCVRDLAVASGQSESAVSHALRLLRASRVVRVRRDGRHGYYRLDDTHVRLLLELALAHVGHEREDA
ncbi:ArsR/SmtB family transcription factor [Actinomadura rubteroloni]|nr:metalloregulator ArsR/SmtB family transcription factor [Actinomadura rubteroloni]